MLSFVRLKSERVLREDGTIRPGVVRVEGSRIAHIVDDAEGGVWDLGDRLLLPGAIDLHGDAFERQWMPRSGVFFPLDMALVDSDRQLLANGITTAFHGLTVSWEPGLRGIEHGRLMVNALEAMRGRLLCDTRVHLRYETSALNETEEMLGWIRERRVHLIGFNDHLEMIARKLGNAVKSAQYAERSGLTLDGFRELVERTRERGAEVWAGVERVAAAAREAGLPIASHDDETPQMRARYAALGVTICEFPLDIETAASARAAGQEVILGGPNVVRGKSHTRRLTARAALEAGLGTVLTSDYYYPSMVQAAFRLVRDGVMELAAAWELVAGGAARAAGLHDRGAIREGLRADLVVIDDSDAALPMVAATVAGGRLVHLADPELWTGHGV
jgi:alpha-D-ribose 1-methylphosphonate 5-triphosphate diphosphatase